MQCITEWKAKAGGQVVYLTFNTIHKVLQDPCRMKWLHRLCEYSLGALTWTQNEQTRNGFTAPVTQKLKCAICKQSSKSGLK